MRSSRRWPSLVALTPRAPRTSNGYPSRASSARIWWLSALTVRLSDSAARVRLPWRTAATKPCSACSGGRDILNPVQDWLAKHSLFRCGSCAYLSPYSTSRANHEHLRRPALQAGPCPGPGDGANAGGRAGTGAVVPRQRPAARRDGGARHARVRGRAAAVPPLARLGGAGDGVAGGAALSGGRLAGLPQAAG